MIKLPGTSVILGQAWSLYKQRLGVLLGVMIVPILVWIGLAVVLTVGGLSAFSLLFSRFAAAGAGLFIILAIIFFLVIFVIQAWSQLALLYAIKDSQEGIGIGEAYRRGWHKILSYWWVTLLAGFITLGGFLLLIVPGVIFATSFSLAAIVLIAEDLKGMNALLKSRAYVKGRWGEVFARFFSIGVLSLIVSLVLIFIFYVLKIPFGAEISRLLIGFFLTPLIVTYSFLVYSNIKTVQGEVAFTPTGGQKATFGVIGILGVLFIPALFFFSIFLASSSVRIARDDTRVSDLQQIQLRLKFYYQDHGSYPSSLGDLDATQSQYLPKTPVDPSTKLPYEYQQQGDSGYQLCAQLETKAKDCVSNP
jgi:hypothetical protein